ncbi:ubiquinone/menaquinone biosynthesis C-methyltransferase UbiE-like [Argiope bruennichi]|uniref:2-methoxy-6-polyprenyl-1,4-benzoquinol methylase, mitochondrial n=1 Tax=Argiope bruennichi TaxID=94029 RepID=A0A8T0EKE9_ARGBR|nr:ubiquinone/menaquinone biosynthesis C-methyltransferase UbiE-like [Argiope bruennichi]KAF8774523.1 2-methoxy-6-polyprenyl-1 like protein [Argiope bruennichi]
MMLSSPVFYSIITSRSYQISRGSFNLFKNLLFNRSFSSENTQTKQQEDDVHFFGFQKVSSSEKRQRVQSVFSNVAAKYDLMNDIMSGGIHRFWKDYFIHTLAPTAGTKLLDVAGGTGDIAFRFLKAVENESLEFSEIQDNPESHVTVLDINANMLSICKNRAEEAGLCNSLTYIQGNAEKLPFPDNTFDAYTIAFGIRNVVHIEEALIEALRVLRPGGRFLCLEFSEVRNPTFNRIYYWYSHEVIPVLGELVAGDWKSYQYLIESIQKFPNQEDFSQMIKEAGFCAVTYENLFNGIAAIHSAYKL